MIGIFCFLSIKFKQLSFFLYILSLSYKTFSDYQENQTVIHNILGPMHFTTKQSGILNTCQSLVTFNLSN